MSLAAANESRKCLYQLWTDETLDDSVGRLSPGLSGTAAQVSFVDPVLCRDKRVLTSMLDREERERATVVFLGGYESRTELRVFMRQVVVTWMFEVTEEQQCEQEVFPLSVIYLDRVVNALDVSKKHLQLIAAVCMFIASKFRDSACLNAECLVVYTDYSITVEDLLTFELLVLEALKWNIHHLTPHDFIDVIVNRFGSLTQNQVDTVKRHAQTFANVCVIDTKFANSPPSLIAACCLYNAFTGWMSKEWCLAVGVDSTLQHATSIDLDCLRSWSHQIDQSWKTMLESSTKSNHEITDNTQNTSDDVFRAKSTDDVASSARGVTPSDVIEIVLND